MQLAGPFLSHYIGDSLGSFNFSLSVTHATAVIFPGDSVPFQIFSPKIQLGANVSQISYLELPTTAPKPGNFSDSMK